LSYSNSSLLENDNASELQCRFDHWQIRQEYSQLPLGFSIRPSPEQNNGRFPSSR